MDIDAFEIINDSVTDSIAKAFNISLPDSFVYTQESSSVTLSQASDALTSGTYRYHYYHANKPLPISATDIESYLSIFDASSDPTKRLTSHLSNARKESPRSKSAQYLTSRTLLPPSLSRRLTKRKRHANPYLAVWRHTCLVLGFLGPLETDDYTHPQSAKLSHPILPIFMHHFGCAVPSLTALQIIQCVAGGRDVIDVGCGNGYYDVMLRREGVNVVSVDDGSSSWRSSFVKSPDLVVSDGAEFLKKRARRRDLERRGKSGKSGTEGTRNGVKAGGDGGGDVLLMIYPITSNNFTASLISAFIGSSIIYIGTQNRNRYTAFSECTMDEYVAREMAEDGWRVTVRVPVPSFPGKDDALYVIQRGEDRRRMEGDVEGK